MNFSVYKGMQYKAAIRKLIYDRKMTVKSFAKSIGLSDGRVRDILNRDTDNFSAVNWDRVLVSYPCLTETRHPEFRDVVPESQLLADRIKELEAEVQKLKDENYYLRMAKSA